MILINLKKKMNVRTPDNFFNTRDFLNMIGREPFIWHLNGSQPIKIENARIFKKLVFSPEGVTYW